VKEIVVSQNIGGTRIVVAFGGACKQERDGMPNPKSFRLQDHKTSFRTVRFDSLMPPCRDQMVRLAISEQLDSMLNFTELWVASERNPRRLLREKRGAVGAIAQPVSFSKRDWLEEISTNRSKFPLRWNRNA
jgi:hypothetical protein